jgi:uncharacterized protein (DUF488 family)
MKIYTNGFTQKSAEEFFTCLSAHNIQRLVDIRINPGGQLAGFARQDDLPYFLEFLANHCQYEYLPILAPTKEILKDYRNDHNWERYVRRFEALMDERDVQPFWIIFLCCHDSCLLCSEAMPDQCHRRLIAERLANNGGMLISSI